MRWSLAVVILLGLTWNAYLEAVLSAGMETAHRHLAEVVPWMLVIVAATGLFAGSAFLVCVIGLGIEALVAWLWVRGTRTRS
jgi:hypothetical protein